MSDNTITVAVQTEARWSPADYSSPYEPSYRELTLDWAVTMADMKQRARKAYDNPLRYEVSPTFKAIVKNCPDAFNGLPVEARSGALIRLVCERKTYEVAV